MALEMPNVRPAVISEKTLKRVEKELPSFTLATDSLELTGCMV
jgi:hypothetical protein